MLDSDKNWEKRIMSCKKCNKNWEDMKLPQQLKLKGWIDN